MDNKLNAVVLQHIEVSPGLAILRVAPDDWVLPDFSAGQFAVLALPGSAPRCRFCDPQEKPADPDKLIKRAYSIASSSMAREYLELYIVLVPSGALTPRLFALKSGDRLWLSPKISGIFTLDDVPADKHVALLSTGTGLAPYMSMLRTKLECGVERRFAVIHGARHSWDLGYRSELRTLDRLCKNFDYIPVISRPNEEAVSWAGEAGYVQDLWRSAPLEQRWGFRPTPDSTHIFLCGNPQMIETMTEMLQSEGYVEHSRKTPGQLYVERYW